MSNQLRKLGRGKKKNRNNGEAGPIGFISALSKAAANGERTAQQFLALMALFQEHGGDICPSCGKHTKEMGGIGIGTYNMINGQVRSYPYITCPSCSDYLHHKATEKERTEISTAIEKFYEERGRFNPDLEVGEGIKSMDWKKADRAVTVLRTHDRN